MTLDIAAQQAVELPADPAPDARFRIAKRILLRLISGAGVLWGAATLSFLGVRLAPGDTVDVLLGEQPRTPEVEAAIRAEWGLDSPAIVQYGRYLWNVAHGDFGRSYVLQRPVSEVIGSQAGPTLALTGAALLVAVVFAVVVATTSARRPRARAVANAVELALISTPSFWLGIVLLSVFSFQWKIFPVAANKGLSALVLPAVALGLSLGAVIAQVLRDGLERALDEPFAVTVRSWSVSETELRLRHGLRHAALPAVTLTGWLVGGLLGGAVIVEEVFGRPGLGRVTVEAVLAQDLPVVLAVAILSATVYVVISTLVDLLYLWLDPRLRRESGGGERR
ncbi:peptide/nickel transport system permease protein [Nocardia tenerifensis]|uniref:Peptide/nickel transport system permease protein n=1 Tax=Nocardia tenerifensis TaxID=228006 RepID=A0A318JX49_9NOCA|nr:ABC transporter permease [Nocardia tenerifensis]PXX62380.1 peptide/nickel transport system permease protein [Nocardia tenerifensis]